MIDEREIMKYNLYVAEYANGATLFLGSLIGDQYVTKEQARGAMNVILASIIRNSNSCPIVTKQEKDAFKNMV